MGRTLCKGLGDRHYTRERRTLYKGETDTTTGGDRLYNGASVLCRVEIFFVAKDIGIPIVFIQNGGDGKSIENDNRLRLSI